MSSLAIATPLESGATPRAGSDRAGISFWIAAAITMLFAIVPAVLWPGDVTWIDDEPGLILNAQIANSEHRLAGHGLFGSFPVPYGPLPTQVYQLFLLFTHDLRVVVAVRAGLSAAVFAGSLLWLARALRLTPWFAAGVVLGPYLWNSQRVLWDCNFLIPIATLGVAAYAAFLRRPSGATLTTALAAITLAPLIHLQALPLFLAVLGHAVWRHRPALRRYRKCLVAAGVGVFWLNAGYLGWLAACLAKNMLDILRFGHSDHHPISQAAMGPIYAAKMFAATDFAAMLGPIRGPSLLIHAALLGSQIILPLAWLGILLCMVRAGRRGAREPVRAQTCASARAALAGIALATLGLQLLLVIALRIPPWLHYGFGTLPIDLLFAWFAVEFLQRYRIGLGLVAIWAMSLACILVTADWQIHTVGYVRGTNSPRLSNQIQVADSLSHYGNLLVWTDVPLYESYPNAIKVLRALAERSPAPPVSAKPLLIRFVPDPTGRSSRIEMVRLNCPSDLPKSAKKIDIGPETNWQ